MLIPSHFNVITVCCPGGKYAAEGSPFCFPCSSGTFSLSGAKECESCPQNTSSYNEASVCCSGGYFAPTGSLDCTTCAPGSFSSPGASESLLCEAYSYNEEAGANSCKTCPSGTVSDAGATECSICAANTYIQPECLSGYTYYESVGSCYYVASAALSWNDAKDSCTDSNNGWLVTVKDNNENTFLKSTLNSGDHYYWIGINDQNFEGTWTWNQLTSYYRNWDVGEPDNSNNADCGSIMDGLWYDTTCSSLLPYVCETAPRFTTCRSCPTDTASYAGASVCCSEGYFAAPGATACSICDGGFFSLAGATTCSSCSPGSYSSAGSGSCAACSIGTDSYAGAKGTIF